MLEGKTGPPTKRIGPAVPTNPFPDAVIDTRVLPPPAVPPAPLIASNQERNFGVIDSGLSAYSRPERDRWRWRTGSSYKRLFDQLNLVEGDHYTLVKGGEPIILMNSDGEVWANSSEAAIDFAAADAKIRYDKTHKTTMFQDRRRSLPEITRRLPPSGKTTTAQVVTPPHRATYRHKKRR
ncbi:hypothetical protein DL767_006805 [Monosporascus sp. MG133]|nr:hypothetical protein DL767_006805 [Monosporascus sp. MG133]